jgi:hypothetical protein
MNQPLPQNFHSINITYILLYLWNSRSRKTYEGTKIVYKYDTRNKCVCVCVCVRARARARVFPQTNPRRDWNAFRTDLLFCRDVCYEQGC